MLIYFVFIYLKIYALVYLLNYLLTSFFCIINFCVNYGLFLKKENKKSIYLFNLIIHGIQGHLSFFCIYYEKLFLSIFSIRALWWSVCDGRGRSGSVSCSGEQPVGDQCKTESKNLHIVVYFERSFLTLTFWLPHHQQTRQRINLWISKRILMTEGQSVFRLCRSITTQMWPRLPWRSTSHWLNKRKISVRC